MIKTIRRGLKRAGYRVAYKCIYLYWMMARPTIRGVQTIILDDEKKRVLLVRHTYMHLGLWDFPGGRTDINEDVLHAARREAAEETGVALNNGRELTRIKIYDAFHWSDVSIVEAITRSMIAVPDGVEIAELQWVPLDRMPDGLSSIAKIIWRAYRESKTT